MNTDALIDMLATGARAIPPGYAARRYVFAIVVGVTCALVLMFATLGPRHDLAQAVLLPMFWVKLAFAASLAALGIAGTWRAATPARRIAPLARAMIVPVAVMAVIALVALTRSAPQARATLILGDTWRSCPWLIAGLSVPVFVAIGWAMKAMAPTRLRCAGAMAGFASGALAALVYSIHCPELAAPFLALWYVAGMLVPAVVGAAVGTRVFRW